VTFVSAAAPRASIGFTVKSGWACAVLLVASGTSRRIADSRRIDLSDPEIPDARQPYHDGFATARQDGPELTRLIAGIKRFGGTSVSRAIRDYRALAPSIRGAGLVVGSLIEPDRIANEHIRIHAREGLLFRTVVQTAASRSRVPCSIWRERDLIAAAVARLDMSEAALRAALSAFGRSVPGPWRAEQKSAALAAWLVLAGAPPRAVGETTHARRR
jgi:hypothetical protein